MAENPRFAAPQDSSSFSFAGRRISYATLLILVLGLSFLAYVRVTGFEFVYDDWLQIVRNPQLDSWKSIPSFFRSDIWGFAERATQGSYFRPIFMLWLLLNFKAFGINPHWWHLGTLLLHVLTTFLVYLLARRLLRHPSAALVAALFFGLTPVHLESVAWITDGVDTMTGVFFLASLLMFLRARDSSRLVSVAESLFFYALALLVKETTIVLPGIVFAYEFAGMDIEEKRPWASRIKPALRACFPYLVITALYFIARRFALHAMASPQQHQPVAMILKTLPAVLWFDIQHLLWPFRTSEFYGLQFVRTVGLVNFVLPAIGVLITAVVLFFLARRSRLVHFAVWWMILPLIPVLIGLALFDEHELVHDRQLYLSSIIFCILLAAAVRRVQDRKIQIAVVALIAAAFAISTNLQSRYWANDFTLYSRGVEIAPRNPVPRNYLAYVYVQKGDYKRGLEMYQQALDLEPNLWRTNITLAVTYFEAGQLPEAEKFYERAIALYPKNANQRNASQYFGLGQTRLRMGRIREAEEPLRTAVEINPSGFGYHYALGYVLYEESKLEEARRQFELDLAANPASPARRQIALIDARLSSR